MPGEPGLSEKPYLKKQNQKPNQTEPKELERELTLKTQNLDDLKSKEHQIQHRKWQGNLRSFLEVWRPRVSINQRKLLTIESSGLNSNHVQWEEIEDLFQDLRKEMNLGALRFGLQH